MLRPIPRTVNYSNVALACAKLHLLKSGYILCSTKRGSLKEAIEDEKPELRAVPFLPTYGELLLQFISFVQ